MKMSTVPARTIGAEDLSIHALVDRPGLNRRAVRQVLPHMTQPERTMPVRQSPVLRVHETRVLGRGWSTTSRLCGNGPKGSAG